MGERSNVQMQYAVRSTQYAVRNTQYAVRGTQYETHSTYQSKIANPKSEGQTYDEIESYDRHGHVVADGLWSWANGA